MLCINGFMFYINKRSNETIYWECIQRKHTKCSEVVCKAKATTKRTSDGKLQVISHTEHSHAPKPEDLHLKTTRYNIKQKAASSNATPCQILQDELRTLGAVADLLSPNMPSKHAQRQAIKRVRAKVKPRDPKTLAELCVPYELKVTSIISGNAVLELLNSLSSTIS